MAATMQLNSSTWDLALDANNNIGLLQDPNGLAQAAACAIKLFVGEYYWDTTIGVPYFQKILGQNPPLALLKEYLVTAALSVDGVASAQVFLSSFDPTRGLGGQVQVISTTGQLGVANFSVVNPQGAG